MKKLPEILTKRGFKFKILKRTPTFALLEQENSEGVVIGYNVVKVLNWAKRDIPHKKSDGTSTIVSYPAKEGIPSPEQFGKNGWCFNQYENALMFYETIIKKDIKAAKKLKLKPNLETRRYIQ